MLMIFIQDLFGWRYVIMHNLFEIVIFFFWIFWKNISHLIFDLYFSTMYSKWWNLVAYNESHREGNFMWDFKSTPANQ